MRQARAVPAPDARRRAGQGQAAAARRGRRRVQGARAPPGTSGFWTAGEASGRQRTSYLLFQARPLRTGSEPFGLVMTQTQQNRSATQHLVLQKSYGTVFGYSSQPGTG